MAVFLSPGVFTSEVDLSVLPTSAGALRPAFIGTANKGPMNTPTFITSAAQYIDVFGEPFPESYLGYAVLAFFEEGNECYVIRVGVEKETGQDDDLADVAIDTSGNNVDGWGRIPLFTGIDYGRINLREVTAADPVTFHAASIGGLTYNDADSSDTHGDTAATLAISGTYTGDIDDAFTVLITGAPDLSNNAAIDGATYQVVRSSDGEVVSEGELDEAILGQSQPLSIGLGLTVVIRVTDGVLDTNDTFTFTVAPDNRKFTVAVENSAGSQYTMPSTTYTTVATLVAAINALLSGESYSAVAYTATDGTVIPQLRTTAAGRWLQLTGTSGWAKEVGQQRYAWDVPRSYLLGANESPYTITTQNNKIVMKAIGETETDDLDFTIASGTNITAAQLAANVDPAGVIGGDQIFDAVALTVPGGEIHLLILTTLTHQLDQLQLMASYSNLKTLRFAEETGIAFPYKRGYRGFFDTRVSIPDSSESDEATPQSCVDDPVGATCASDTAYFANIVGYLVATSAGTWVDDMTVTIEVFSEGIGETSGRFKLTIKDANGAVLDIVEDVSFDKSAARYIGNIVNPGSTLGGKNGNVYINWEPRPTFLDYDTAAAAYTVRQPATFNGREFTGQANGIPTDPALSSELDAAVIGNPALSSGIFALQNPETYDINLLLTPGFSSGSVIGQCLQMCEARGDVLYLVDPPFGLRPQQVVDWHNGMLLSDLTNSINSSYGALYWSWIKSFDQFSRAEIWVPPSGRVAAIFSRTSRVAEQWSAPAGLNRGRMLTALQVEYSPSQGERNLLYGSGNAVNPIVNFPQSGITIWGQRTLQRAQTALDRVSVRMLLIYIKKNLTRLLQSFIFEPNDSILQSQITATVNPFMADIQARRGMTGFKIVCDASNNTPERIDRGEIWIAAFIKPTRAAEFVALNLVVLKTGGSFSAQEVLAAGGVVGS